MTLLDEVKTNGHSEPASRAWDTRLARIERRLADIAESGEQRVAVLRDAIADFAAAELDKRDEEIAVLKKQLADLQQKLEQQAAIDQRVHEISVRLEEKQARRDGGKDGDFIKSMNTVIAQERVSARKEFKAADEEMQRALEGKLAAVEERLKAVPGKLPVAKIWHAESVIYEGEVVGYEGSLYQARKDTAQVPGGPDWISVARAGRDGCDGLTPNIRGTFNVYKKYRRLDIVNFDGAAFIACRDHPGICPGDGWQALAVRGKAGDRGPPGPRGTKGERGAKGDVPEIVGWHLERETYRAFPVLADGKMGPELNLRPLFEQFFLESHAADV